MNVIEQIQKTSIDILTSSRTFADFYEVYFKYLRLSRPVTHFRSFQIHCRWKNIFPCSFLFQSMRCILKNRDMMKTSTHFRMGWREWRFLPSIFGSGRVACKFHNLRPW